jgi:hypothetical protein
MYPARVIYSIAFFVLIMILLTISKPSAVFAPDGSVRPFGVGQDGTVFPLGVVTVVVAVMAMYTFSMIDLLYG